MENKNKSQWTEIGENINQIMPSGTTEYELI